MTYLLDTNIISEVMRTEPDPAVDEWFRTLERRTPVHQADSLIAACAWEHGLVIATRNTRDFEGYGIALFNPFEFRR